MNRSLLLVPLVVGLVFTALPETRAATTTYTYDDLNRLVQVEREDCTVITYAYDPLGNRTAKSVMVDRDCDGVRDSLDCAPDDPGSAPSPQTWYADADGDGYGTADDPLVECTQPPGYVSMGGDCNDYAGSIHPGADEECDAVDNDCDGGVDNVEGCVQTCDSSEVIVGFSLIPDAVTTSTVGDSTWNGSGYGTVSRGTGDVQDEYRFALLDASGEKIGPDRLLATVPLGAGPPRIAWNGGEYGIVWHDDRSGRSQIYFARVGADGSPIGTDVLVPNNPADARFPVVEWSGTVWGLAWTDSRHFAESGTEIYFASIDSDGIVQSGPARVTDTPGASAWASLAWNGTDCGLVWQNDSDGNREIYFQRVSAEGIVLDSARRVTDDPASSELPDLVWADDRYGLTWGDRRGSGGNYETFFVELDSTGTALMPEIAITEGVGHSIRQEVAWTGEEYELVWQNDGEGPYDLWFARVAAGGAPIESALRVTGTPEDSTHPSVSWNGTDFGLSWTENGRFVFLRVACNCVDDLDDDGVSSCNDCNDSNDTVYPGAPEVCDGVDNDCDDSTDEDFVSTATSCGVGECAGNMGVTQCVNGIVEDTCDPLAGAAGDDAVCDGLDDDCDGVTDEDYPSTETTCGVGECAGNTGVTQCVAGTVEDTCDPFEGAAADDATCDGLDDDCDGAADEDYAVTPTTCGVGECADNVGVSQCVGGVVEDTCDPFEGAAADDATCNGLDDDCDGAADEDYAVTPTTCGVGECADNVGVSQCVGGEVEDTCDPFEGAAADDATCDSLDDDCDGAADEDYAVTPTTCGVGECADNVGVSQCVGGAVEDTCDPFEGAAADDATCDGLDDDCDGAADEDYAVTPTTCGVGECADNVGVSQCVGGVVEDTCDPFEGAAADDATCDGLDDDCDGAADEEFVDTPTTCGVGECAGNAGVTQCVDGEVEDTCDPLEGAAPDDATCDGLDDDCDGAADEEFAEIPTTCGVGDCAGNTGITQCVGGAVEDSCNPLDGAMPEHCDGLDNDCDGAVPAVEDDLDADGVRVCGGDCEDSDGTIYPGAEELCDGVGNDCSDPAWPTVPVAEQDLDLDGIADCDLCELPESVNSPGIVSTDSTNGSRVSVVRSHVGFGVAWTTAMKGVRFALLASDGTVVLESELAADSVDAGRPGIAWNGSEFGVVWHDSRSGTPQIFFATVSPGGVVGDVIPLTSGVAEAKNPGTAWGGGRWGAVWFDTRHGGREVYFTSILPTGPFPLDGERVSETEAFSDWADLAWGGEEFGIVWQEVIDGNREIVFRRENAPLGTFTRITDDPANSEVPRIVHAGDGFGVAWGDRRGVDGNYETYFVKLGPNGMPLHAEIPLTEGAGASAAQDLTWTGTEFVVVWHNDDSGQKQIVLARLMPDGTPIDDPVAMTESPRDSRRPVIVLDGAKLGLVWIEGSNIAYQAVGCDCWNDDGDGFSICSGDCDDGDDAVFPGAPPLCDALNNDCDDPIWPDLPASEIDGDGDAFRACEECDDDQSTVYPGAPQLCDRINNDCDDTAWPDPPESEIDGDTDGFTPCEGDCLDTDPTVYPGAAEICNARDDDCDMVIDEDERGEDSDNDGVANVCDNCVEVVNPSQLDSDGDTVGNFCDNCDVIPNPQQEDADLDERGDDCDNCPADYNPLQDDVDGDGHGNACDNCIVTYNPTQTDNDGDSEGDICDLNDGVIYITFATPEFVDWQSESGFEAWNSYRGDLSVLQATHEYTQQPGSNPFADRQCDLGSPFAQSGDDPGPNQLAFYLTSGVSASGEEGDLGNDSTGAVRPNAHPCP